MKSILIVGLALLSLPTLAQKTQEARSFGKEINQTDAVASTQLLTLLGEEDAKPVKIIGTINEVCQAKGCWMTMNVGADQSMRITFKDYGFFVPTSSSGKEVIIQGMVKKETTSVEMLKHYAKDAGREASSIAAITEPETSLVFVAEGVLILE